MNVVIGAVVGVLVIIIIGIVAVIIVIRIKRRPKRATKYRGAPSARASWESSSLKNFRSVLALHLFLFSEDESINNNKTTTTSNTKKKKNTKKNLLLEQMKDILSALRLTCIPCFFYMKQR